MAALTTTKLGSGHAFGQYEEAILRVTVANLGAVDEWIAKADHGFDDVLSAAVQPLVQGGSPQRVYVPFVIPATQFAAGTSVFTVAPIAGNITRVLTWVDATVTGEQTITVELATVAVVGASITIVTAAAVGDIDDSGVIASVATTKVALGGPIEIVCTSTPSAGSCSGVVEICGEPTITLNAQGSDVAEDTDAGDVGFSAYEAGDYLVRVIGR